MIDWRDIIKLLFFEATRVIDDSIDNYDSPANYKTIHMNNSVINPITIIYIMKISWNELNNLLLSKVSLNSVFSSKII